MATKLQLAPPPRDVPEGLRLRILAQYDVVASTMYTIPAALLLLIAAVSEWPRFLNWGFVAVATLLLFLALQAAASRLGLAAGTLRRLRDGLPSVGRMVSCRYGWEKKGRELPYAEFLGDYAAIAARLQVRKVTGGAVGCFVMVFIVPFVVFIAFVGVALLMKELGLLAGQVESDVDAAYFGKFTAAAAYTFALMIGGLWVWRKYMMSETQRFIDEGRAWSIAAGHYKEHFRAEAAKPPEQIRLKDPLPADHSAAIELACRVEYLAAGERRVSSGRVRLSDRLDLTGIEPLIYDPLHPERIDILVGLPPGVAIDATGRWRDLPRAGSIAKLAFAGAMVLAVVGLLALNVRLILA